ncbi:putative von Willebrand factor type A [metagenome]|uniref:Putative von Willebrand factor type A n=1 Tax=metagenome TaxID=256318 RepID=A0A2P2BXB9_9ZZZZ
MTERPGAQLARRPLHFFLLADCSGSMAAGGKMTALNTAIREVLPHLAETSQSNPHAEVTVRVVAFATGARWHVEAPTTPEDLVWQDLTAKGYTDLGAALDLVSSALTVPPMEERALAPALVLVSDGMPTDDFGEALDRLLALPWGARSVRMAVAIGQDADYATLARFIGDPAIEPVTAASPEQLMMALRWATVHVARAASSLAPPGPPPIQVPHVWTDAPPEEIVW